MASRKGNRSTKNVFETMCNELPDGVVYDDSNALTTAQSKLFHPNMKIHEKTSKIIASNRIMINCREGKCAEEELTLTNAMKCANWLGKHNPKKHPNVQSPAFSIGSVWTVNSDSTMYLTEYMQRDKKGKYLTDPKKRSLYDMVPSNQQHNSSDGESESQSTTEEDISIDKEKSNDNDLDDSPIITLIAKVNDLEKTVKDGFEKLSNNYNYNNTKSKNKHQL